MKSPDKFIVDWSGRALDYSEEDIAAVVGSMKNADPLTQGKYLKAFESEFADYLGVPNTFAVSNCTNALHIIARLSSLKKGDEVIIPAHTFCATAIPFASTGAKIVWADIDPETFLISPNSVENLISRKTRVIVPVHLYGLMADMDAIMKIGRDYNCLVVEDAAQALGAGYHGRKAGSIGDFGAYSFHGQKHLTTLGEGGALTVKSEESAQMVPGLRHNGVRPFDAQENYWTPAMSDVDMDIDGIWPFNCCLGEPQCALASSLLKKIDAMNKVRAKRAKKFRDALSGYPELQFQSVPPGRDHAYHLLPARFTGKTATSHDFIRMMAFTYRVKVIVQYYPLYRYPLFRKMGVGKAQCPETDKFFDNMVSFPFHLWMSDHDFDYMIESTIKTVQALRKKGH
jgi:dTDP-4-amino-4,6-dideoxygalactose transaminase